MRISDCMTRDVRVADPDQTLREAARMMAELDAGILPVGENDRLVGMITDRDIAVRAVAHGKSPDTPVREIMNAQVRYCYEDDDVDEVLANMADIQVRRLPVLSREKRLIGIVSIGDLSKKADDDAGTGHALGGITQPGGQHTQAAH